MSYPSSRIDDWQPVIVGVGQCLHRGDEIVEPITLMERAALGAADDSGVAGRVLLSLRSVQVVNILAGGYADPAESLARRLRLPDGERITTTIGGTLRNGS